jgi:Rrf2 family protein
MKFSINTFYGMKAILTLASRYGEGSVSVSAIAKRERIPVAVLGQVLNGLKRQGIVKSVRGPQGGYVLAKKPSDFPLDELLMTLEGRPFTDLAKKDGLNSESDEVAVADYLFWKHFVSAIHEKLSDMSVKGLLDEARQAKNGKSKNGHTFHI